MDSFKSGSGVVTVINSAGLMASAIYFYRQNVELKSEIENMKRQLTELRLRQERSERDTRKDFKHLRKEITNGTLQASNAEDMFPANASEGNSSEVAERNSAKSVGPHSANLCPGHNALLAAKSGGKPLSTPGRRPEELLKTPVNKFKKERVIPPSNVDIDSLSEDL